MVTRPTLAAAGRLSRTLLPYGSAKSLSTSVPRHHVYDTTIANLNIDNDTRVIYQGKDSGFLTDKYGLTFGLQGSLVELYVSQTVSPPLAGN